MRTHAYVPCDHPGRHGYTLPGDPAEYEFCETCRSPEGARWHDADYDQELDFFRNRTADEGMAAR